jgi:hypothetical protein
VSTVNKWIIYFGLFFYQFSGVCDVILSSGCETFILCGELVLFDKDNNVIDQAFKN